MGAFPLTQWLRVRPPLERQAREHRLTTAQRVMNRPETDLEVAQRPLPVGIDVSAIPTLHHLNAFRHEQHGRYGQHGHQSFETGRVSHFGIFQPEQPTFLVQKAFLNLKSLAIFGKGLHARWFIAHHLPLLWPVRRTGQSNMDGTKTLPGEGDVVQTAGFPWCELHLIHPAQPLAIWGSKNQVGLDPNAVMPSTDPEPGHQLRVAEPSVR